MSVEIRMTYNGDLHCQATHGPSSSTMITDAPTDNGGRGDAFSPTDLVATALGTCILTIMGLAAKRGGFAIDGASMTVVKEMAAAPIRRIGQLTVTITVPGASGLTSEQRAKLQQAADLCPVKQSLHPDVKVQTKFIFAD